MEAKRTDGFPADLSAVCARGTESRTLLPKRKKLSPQEQASPLSYYFERYPLYYPRKSLLDYVEAEGKIPEEDAIPPQNFLWLMQAEGYDRREFGYCRFSDGSGYIATYRVRPDSVTEEMEQWYRRWSSVYSKGAVRGQGNLRYKLWEPADHIDCHFVNWKDNRLGTFYRESMDLGAGEKIFERIHHPFPLSDFGFTDQQREALRQKGAQQDGMGYFETFSEPGSNFGVSISRPCPLGGVEIRSRKWIGWRPMNGKLIRDPTSNCQERYLKLHLLQDLVKWEHLYSLLPELYAEYHNLPADAD